MALRSVMVKDLRAAIARHDTAAAKQIFLALSNARGFVKGAPELLDWALEQGHTEVMPLLAVHMTPKEAAARLLKAHASESLPSEVEGALWVAAKEAEAVRLAVREDNVAFFERAQKQVMANHRDRAFHQAMNEAIQGQRPAWVTRLLTMTSSREPTIFHARYLANQDVPADSPLLQAFEPTLAQWGDRKALQEFLLPMAQESVRKGHHGPFLWALTYGHARDESWLARYPNAAAHEQGMVRRTLIEGLLPWVARENRLAWLEDVLPWADVNHDKAAALRLAVENGHRDMVCRLLPLSDVGLVIQQWSAQKEWHHVETLADWVSSEQRHAWLEAYGEHLPRLRAKLRDEAAHETTPDRPSRPRPRV